MTAPSTKTEIVEELGESTLLLPFLVNRGLVANERAKYLLSLLQAARARADQPAEPFAVLRAERLAAGVRDPSYDEVVVTARRADDGRYLITGAARIHEELFAALGAQHGEQAILVRPEASTGDVAALAVCGGLLTARGARTSHAAVVARQLGVVCLVDCTVLTIDAEAHVVRIGTRELQEGDPITVDGSDDSVYAGALDLVEERPTELVGRVHTWQRDQSAQRG